MDCNKDLLALGLHTILTKWLQRYREEGNKTLEEIHVQRTLIQYVDIICTNSTLFQPWFLDGSIDYAKNNPIQLCWILFCFEIFNSFAVGKNCQHRSECVKSIFISSVLFSTIIINNIWCHISYPWLRRGHDINFYLILLWSLKEKEWQHLSFPLKGHILVNKVCITDNSDSSQSVCADM